VGHLLQLCSSGRLSAPDLDNTDVVRCQSIKNLNYGSGKLSITLTTWAVKPRTLGRGYKAR
jgi:hypothetical protein